MQQQESITVLQLGKFYPIKGGVEKVMYNLMTGMASLDVRCDMLCASAQKKTLREVYSPKNRLLGTSSVFKLAATMISPAMVSKLRSICHRYRIIHIHHPDPMACLALYFSAYKGKVLLHWHSDILRQRALMRFYKPFQSWLVRRADLIIGTTPVYVKQSPALAKVQHKVSYLPIGIDSLRMEAAPQVQQIRAAYPGKKIVLSVGRLVGYKGFCHLIEAASYLPDEYVVLIVGDGPLREVLAKQITEAGLQEKVRLLGYVTDQELPYYYNACDLFCLSSTVKTEAFAIVQIEAMSCAKPIVACKIPESGVPWVNADGVSGRNVEPGDAKALQAAICEICSSPETYAQYSARALERFQTLFQKEKMIQGCYEIYQQLCQGQEPAPTQ